MDRIRILLLGLLLGILECRIVGRLEMDSISKLRDRIFLVGALLLERLRLKLFLLVYGDWFLVFGFWYPRPFVFFCWGMLFLVSWEGKSFKV